ncbi:MAG TPA: FimV/HubP family polar landmark protein [Gammaproteobacteria bacterium]|nr:FimV/HubP family polar landmark protein [Gammaproteobacteria bacterium]
MRALARWGVMPLLAAPLGAWGLGLGDIELQSALNQPFHAQIVLVSATPDELAGLKIAIAGEDSFKRYGIERAGFLSQLQFRIVNDRSGRNLIEVSSRESIAEPFVDLLVEATWPRGRLLRQYTVLLDPPVLLPAPAAPTPVRPAETRRAEPAEPAAPITRPAPPPATRPQPAPAPVSPPASSSPAPVPRATSNSPEGTYGPVQRSETLWAIAERFRPEGVSMNQMMVALFEANPQAFGGNMNVLRVGATLRLPQANDVQSVAVSTANAEVQRQTDEWQNRSPRLVLVPPTAVTPTEPARTSAPEPAAKPPPARTETPPPAPATEPAPAVADTGAAPDRRLLEVQDEQLRNLQAAAATDQATPPAPAANASPGVDVEPPQVFTDETKPAADAAPAPAATVPSTPAAPAPAGTSLVSQILGWVSSPFVLIGVGVAALLLAALWFVRRRRDEPEDVTGRWEALEAEVDDDDVRKATERMRRQAPEESIVVEEQASRPRRAEAEPASDDTRLKPPPRAPRAAAPAPAPAVADETLSSQTVINLDQADPVAEADFHMAYGLYDQAAELVQKALDAAPNRRDLKLKLLEVFFVWGNKDAFLKAAQGLRKEIGQKPDADWDKVVIMGKQICPDERLFSEATAAAGEVDVDLQAGDSPLDLAFDDASAGGVDLDLGGSDSGLDLDLESSSTRELKMPGAPAAAAKQPPAKPAPKSLEDSLDIGERTAAGLEAALFEETQGGDDASSRTTPDLAADSLAITQESPTIESSRNWGRATAESPTSLLSLADVPTVETPTIESPAADAPTVETPTVQTPFRGDTRTVEQPAFGGAGASDRTAEIDLDDLGLDVKDLENLPQDLGDLSADTREQVALKGDDELLSATGVTQVLVGGEEDDDFVQRKTSVLSEDDATMLAPSFDDNTLTGTEVLEHRLETDESGDTSLVRSLRKDDGLDLNLDDLSAALHGADTVEQHQPRSFSRDVFGGGDTPLDLDIGSDVSASDDPTGTEEVSPLDPQTMTEVGTKLDLARAYIDMGDPEGARSILEEVLDEGDPGQRREAQSLIDVLRA